MSVSIGEILKSAPLAEGRRYSTTPRRTGEPIRRLSYAAARPSPEYRHKITRKEAREIVLAAKLYDTNARTDGKRPLGRTAVQILELLANLAAYSGRVEPSYSYIMEKVGCARDTIARALKALRAHGFLNWMRRYVPTGNAEGPQVKQTSNAYRITLPALAKRLIDAFFKPRQIIPDDIAHEAQERARHIETMRAGLTMREQLALDLGADNPLAEALARLHDSMAKRESDKQTESGIKVL